MVPFTFNSAGEIHFGRGEAAKAADLICQFGPSVALVHGASPTRARWLLDDLIRQCAQVSCFACDGEPTLNMLQHALSELRSNPPEVIVSLGGGSVIDMGKALAALLPGAGDALDHLEGVGKGLPLTHEPIPFVAIPTTAGTGAEVTKNAVIAVSEPGKPRQGRKVSLRDRRMIPNVAVIDSTLMQGAPKPVILAAGLDAITQVIEPYVSARANPMTDALCQTAIPTGLQALKSLMETETPEAWDAMAWTSLCGGLALANSGLGAVHGLAGVIGGAIGAPHGAVCGALLPHVLRANLAVAKPGTETHGRLSWISDEIARALCVEGRGDGFEQLEYWARCNELRPLGQLGVSAAQSQSIAQAALGASSMKVNPVPLTEVDLISILANAT